MRSFDDHRVRLGGRVGEGVRSFSSYSRVAVCVCALFGDRRFVAHGLLPQIRASVVTNSAQLTVRTGNFATVASWTGDRQVRVNYLECCVY